MRVPIRLVGLVLAGVFLAAAQTQPNWRKVGGSSVDLMLASPATGPVERVWYSPDGSLLFARTLSGKVFETADFETWAAVAEGAETNVLIPATAARLPEPGARVFSTAANPSKMYSLGQHLLRSEDGGHSWTNLTAYKSESVVGFGQHSLAISPADPNQLAVANDYGVWRSMDGGLSWAGLNRSLPNLAVRRILSTPSGTAGARVQVDRLGVLELPPGGSIWVPALGAELPNEAVLRQRYSAMVRADITVSGSAGDVVYAGSSDGRIWVSFDGGQTFPAPPWQASGPVERIFVDAAEPRVALAALGGEKGPHVLRTTNSGAFWDPLDGNLPDAPAHGVTAERTVGAVYVATDKGVFFARVDLENASRPDSVAWVSLSDRLPAAAATDVRLDPAGVQLYAALDGHGVYAAAAPHRLRNLRIVSAADFSTRAAAPGSLLSVIGGLVHAAHGGNLDYPVLAASDAESQIQVPFEAVGPSVSLAFETNAGRVTLVQPVQPVSPAIFVGHDGAPWLYDADSGLPIDARNTAHSNGRVQIMATGLGKVRPDWPTGLAAPLEDPPVVAASIRAFLDGSPVEVSRATLAPGYIGFYLVEVQLPAVTNAGVSELHIAAGGQESNHVQIVIEP
jgi:uncharacterized protein (TIGR03437 family)